jgi:transposase
LLKRHLPLDADGLRLAHNVLACPAADQLVAAEKPFPVERERQANAEKLALLWEEYRGHHHNGYGYSRFCDLYVEWRHGITATMRQTHAAGEKLFVDFAGDTVPVFDGLTGEVRAAKIFVAVMGASNYTFVQARFSEALPDWIGAHVDALTFLGGVPKALVCDNLKAGVTAASRYEPGINRTYQDLAAHYGTTILPARPRKPRDKAKVEAVVLIVQRWILARLRNRRFFSLAELNVAIRILVDDLNARLMRKLGASRREFFDTIDRPALMPLPAEPYQYAEWRRARVAPDYHVEVQGHFYSVPSRMIRQVVEVRATETTIEVFHRGTRIASHARSGVKRRHTTIPEHMPSAHRRYAFWTPTRLLAAAEQIGPSTVALCEAIMRTKPHPEQGFRSCLGILRMEKTYGARRLEAACRRGISIGAASYRSIASILKTGLDKAFLPDISPDADPIQHGNIRGRGYYH